MKEETIISLGIAAGVLILGWKLSESVGGAIEETGHGLRDTLSGAGSALEYSGMGVYELGSGAGSALEYSGMGVYELGKGTGEGISYIGKGTGYAISGANLQDIIQTILNKDAEASTYGNSSLRTSNNQTDTGIMPTADKTLGLTAFSPLNIGSWVVSKTSSALKKVVSVTGSAISTGNSGGGIRQTPTAAKNISGMSSQQQNAYSSLGVNLVSTRLGVIPESSLRSSKSSSSTKKWYNPLSWF